MAEKGLGGIARPVLELQIYLTVRFLVVYFAHELVQLISLKEGRKADIFCQNVNLVFFWFLPSPSQDIEPRS